LKNILTLVAVTGKILIRKI